MQRLDFRQCLPRSDGRATGVTSVVLAEHDRQTTGPLRQLYLDAKRTTIQPESAALVGDLDLVESPAGARSPAPTNPASAELAGSIRLLGYDRSGPTVAAGRALYLTLYREAEANRHEDDTGFGHFGQGNGSSRLIAQHDGPPCQGVYRTARRRAGDVVPDSFAVVIPSGTPAGTHPLLAGWYVSQTQQRVPVTSADSTQIDNRVLLGTISVARP